jgi:DNA-binding response OmpR family regulator
MARILLIDDDDLLREMLAAELVRAGHTVIQAKNGRLGLEVFRTAPLDLIVTDMIMPDREGLETIVAVRGHQSAPPIIAISGSGRHAKHYLELAMKFGAKQVLAKPFAAEKLLRAIDDLLANDQPLGAPS